MKHNDCGQLDDYLDGALAAGATGAFEEHLDTCASCRRAVVESKAVSGLLKRAFAVEQAASLLPEPTTAAEPIAFTTTLLPSRRSWQLRLRDSGRRRAAGLLAAAAILLLWAAASLWTVPRESPRNSVADNSADGNREPPQIVATAPRRPKAIVRVANDDQFVAIPMPSTQEDVTIVWIYPTVH